MSISEIVFLRDLSRKEHMSHFRTLPTPTTDLLPSLMVEICLVLAPDANFFLNMQTGKERKEN